MTSPVTHSHSRQHIFGWDGLVPYLPPQEFSIAPVSQQEMLFLRDFGLRRLDGSFLLPYAFKNDPEPLFKTLLPPSGVQFLVSCYRSFGNGFESASREMAKILFPNPAPVSGRTAIEGGNCFLFNNPEGLPTALIGINSLVLSLVALREQEAFSLEAVKKIADAITTPSDWAFRMARNSLLYAKRVPYDQQIAHLRSQIRLLQGSQPLQQQLDACLEKRGTETAYRETIQAPVSAEDKEKYLDLAREFEAQILLTKEEISREVQVPLERIAFVEQERFHIDMEIFVANSVVYSHSETLAQAAMGSHRDYKGYKVSSLERLPANESALKANASRIAALGCQFIPVPGIFETPKGSTINFMNGVVNNTIFFTNGAPLKFEERQTGFARSVHTVDPSLQIRFIGTGCLSEVLKENRGGLHCLTQES